MAVLQNRRGGSIFLTKIFQNSIEAMGCASSAPVDAPSAEDFGAHNITAILVGLDNAGKTTTLNAIIGEPFAYCIF